MGLLFVCTGNVCRSAAAELLLRARAADALDGAVEIGSAGTWATPDRPVHRRTAAALERRGLSVDRFASRRLTAEFVDGADLILTMTADHREEVVGVNPRALHRVFTLLEAAALCASLPADLLDAVPARDRTRALAEALAEARAVHRRLPDPCDIDDPVDQSRRRHVRIVEQIDAALVPLVRALRTRPEAVPQGLTRIRELPPVPRLLAAPPPTAG